MQVLTKSNITNFDDDIKNCIIITKRIIIIILYIFILTSAVPPDTEPEHRIQNYLA